MEYTNINFNDIQEFPYIGKFLRATRTRDENDNPIEETFEFLRCSLDIEITTQEIQNIGSQANYNIWMPLIKENGNLIFPVIYNDIFYGIRLGQRIKCIVINVEPSQMGTRVWLKREEWDSEDTNFDDL
jgi:hypothetical protein